MTPVFEIKEGYEIPKNKISLIKYFQRKIASEVPSMNYCPNCQDIPKLNEWTKNINIQNLGIFHIANQHHPYHHWEPFYIGEPP